MLWTHKPTDAVLDAVRSAVNIQPDITTQQLVLDLTNGTDIWDPRGAPCPERMRYAQAGYALALVEAERRTLVSAPPSKVESAPDATVDVQVGNHVADWLRRIGADRDWSESDYRPRQLRIDALRYTDDNHRTTLSVEVEERPVNDFGGPVAPFHR